MATIPEHPPISSNASPENPERTPVRPRKRRETPSQKFFRQMRRNRFWLLLYLWAAAALPELVLHCATCKSWGAVVSPGLVLAPLFAVVNALFVFILCTAIPNPKVNFGISAVYSFVVFLLCASQLVYYQVFGTFYSVYSMANGGAAFQFGNTIFSAILARLPLILLMAVPLVLLLIFGRKAFSFKPLKSWKSHIPMAVACAAVQLIAVLILPIFGGTGDTTAFGLYHQSSDSYLSVNKLGLMTAFRLDLQRFLTGAEVSGSIVLEDPSPEETVPVEPSSDSTNPGETDSTEPSETAPAVELGLNILDIDFDGLIENEDNEAVAQVHEYFSTRTASMKNEKTGLFSGCNLILITAEAFSELAVDESRTPILYKMMHEGYYFTNYYVPDWGVSTTDGEYAHLTGTIPKDGEWSFEASVGNYMPLTMAQQLIKQGYSAYAYHGHTYDYYERDSYLENLGYEYKAYGYGLDVTTQWPESDVEVIDLSTGDYVTDTPFTAYYMTISGHREFNFYGNCMSIKNQAAVADLPYSETVQAYLACQLELENAMTLLLERLEAAGVLENTVIVLTADHYPNGLTPEQIGELLGHTPESNFELYKNGCIIWKPGMEPETIDEPCSHLDLLPTLSNLFGLEFDSRLYMGRDVFSSARPFVCFRNRSWITDKAMYNAETGEVINLTDEEVNEVYVETMNTEVNNRFTVSARILEYDYWRILFG